MANRALLRAFRAWAPDDFARATQRFGPSWRSQLESSWKSVGRSPSAEALSSLRQEHEATTRPDLNRVHSSWFIRALREESWSVQRAVTAHVSSSVRPALLKGLDLDPADLATDLPPDPDAISWVMALWAERLVGSLPQDDDPPVIVALTRLTLLDLSRLVKVCGLVKHAFAIDSPRRSPIDESFARFSPIDRVRLGFFRRRIGIPDPRLSPLARKDLAYIEGDRRRAHSRLGLVTIGRLLDAAEVHRSRWAVQHLPYSVAKLARRRMSLPIPSRAAFAWESWILEAAWVRLLSEQRISGGRDWLPVSNEGELN